MQKKVEKELPKTKNVPPKKQPLPIPARTVFHRRGQRGR